MWIEVKVNTPRSRKRNVQICRIQRDLSSVQRCCSVCFKSPNNDRSAVRWETNKKHWKNLLMLLVEYLVSCVYRNVAHTLDQTRLTLPRSAWCSIFCVRPLCCCCCCCDDTLKYSISVRWDACAHMREQKYLYSQRPSMYRWLTTRVVQFHHIYTMIALGPQWY